MTQGLERMADEAGQARTRLDDMLRQLFGFPPPMEVDNVTMDVEPPALTEVWAMGNANPVAMVPMNYPQYTVHMTGHMAGRTQAQWELLQAWTQVPAHGVVNTVITQDRTRAGTDFGPEVRITAHPAVPNGQAWIMDEHMIQQAGYTMAPLMDAMPAVHWVDYAPIRYDTYFAVDPTRQKAAGEARERALELFLDTLTDRERAEYDTDKTISVTGSRGTSYKINCTNGQSGNVHWYDKSGNWQGELCAHPFSWADGGNLPDPDAWCAQRLMLLTEEEKFVNMCNVLGGFRPSVMPQEELTSA